MAKRGRPPKKHFFTTISAKDLDKLINQYFEETEAKGELPILPELASHIGIAWKTLLSTSEEANSKFPEHVAIVKNAIRKCESAATKLLLEKRQNIVGPIFYLKNCFNWQDKTEVSSSNKLNINFLKNIPEPDSLPENLRPSNRNKSSSTNKK